MGLWRNRDTVDGDGTWSRQVMGMGVALINQSMMEGDEVLA